ncbi:nematode resistance protein-like HSPRO2 [Andrographis paniculata]|uniref:nematode resistance protein-like HSPRO2 n=1 Tax=Andrographis paniculata TaxID=175694 RepID=UPI0021E7024B|nr:nematode resistance protein-like HSPRO2 [Andrographis paniculata]
MVELDWKTKMISSEMPSKSPRKGNNKLQICIPPQKIRVSEVSAASEEACSAYEQYLRLPELKKLWSAGEFPGWKSEAILKPAFSGLEITFRFVTTVLSDPRPYVNRREWRRRVVALADSEVEIISLLCEEDEDDTETRGTIPVVDLTSDGGALSRENSSAEVWKMADDTVVVSHVSEASLLPRLADWEKFEDVARKIHFSIEYQMQRCPYTLGLGEPNLSGKTSINYDAICKPSELHALKKSTNDDVDSSNFENRILYATHQILESWILVGKELLRRISDEIDGRRYEKASSLCWILEKVWSIVNQIEDLHMLMDPDDFLRLKTQLMIKATSNSELFCFRSRELVEITKTSKDLKHKVPAVLEVEVDPTGGPRIQNAAMELYRRKDAFAKIHLLQAMQAVESAVKKFYFSYKQLLAAVMGSLEATGAVGSDDPLSQIFMEPTYFPSLDAAKTFLGERWSYGGGRRTDG